MFGHKPIIDTTSPSRIDRLEHQSRQGLLEVVLIQPVYRNLGEVPLRHSGGHLA
ncbi:uncharacterized protein METZ01_LOCUS463885 [marine metagenome]|uniref:Uncharacterized protein n=1 Tax=marine metagenome TaxID=408172 RepID=A0A383ATU3_9ZZZZ